MVAGRRWLRRGVCTSYRADRSADQRTCYRAGTAASETTDPSTRARTDQVATEGALAEILGTGAGRRG